MSEKVLEIDEVAMEQLTLPLTWYYPGDLVSWDKRTFEGKVQAVFTNEAGTPYCVVESKRVLYIVKQEDLTPFI